MARGQNPEMEKNTFDIFLRAPDGRNLDGALDVREGAYGHVHQQVPVMETFSTKILALQWKPGALHL